MNEATQHRNTQTARIAIISDIHADRQHGTKQGDRALELLEDFVGHINNLAGQDRPDLVLDLGDRISDLNPEMDRRTLERVAEIFSKLRVPRAHLLGNHDVVHLSRQQNAEILETSMEHRVLELAGWRLLLWYPNARLNGHGFQFDPADLEWLETNLRDVKSSSTVSPSTVSPSAVFSHAPYSGASMLGNHYFEPMPQYAGYKSTLELRSILERHTVSLCLTGHVHWNSLCTIDGIPHITVQSLTERFTTHPNPANAWAMLELGQRIKLEVFGHDPLRLELPLRRAAQHWLKWPDRNLIST
jgi:3',5'-cyclic-AMP phosphodiesterase